MGKALGEVLPLAVAVAIFPVPIIAIGDAVSGLLTELEDNAAIAALAADLSGLAVSDRDGFEARVRPDRAQQVANVISDRLGTELQLFGDLFRREPAL